MEKKGFTVYNSIMTEDELHSHQSGKRLQHIIGTKEMSPQLITQTSKLSADMKLSYSQEVGFLIYSQEMTEASY